MIVGSPEGDDSVGSRKASARQLYVEAIYGQEASAKRVCREPITFTYEDLSLGAGPHRDALVIAMDIVDTVVRRILVDTSSSVNVLYLDTFKKLRLDRDVLRPVMTPLMGFTGYSIEAEGSIKLLVELGTYPDVKIMEMEFVVVQLECSHNAILGRSRNFTPDFSLLYHQCYVASPTLNGTVSSSLVVSRIDAADGHRHRSFACGKPIPRFYRGCHQRFEAAMSIAAVRHRFRSFA
nr:uncharacterized protein LOC109156529 [Ipomoea batatas]